MKRTLITITALAVLLFVTNCTALRTRVRWASVGDTPLICCGGVGNYIQIPASPSYGEAVLAYIQIVNLPGGCDSFRQGGKAAELARQIETELDEWGKCPDRCGGSFSGSMGKLLSDFKNETIKQGPNMRSSSGPPCFADAHVAKAR